MRNPKHEAVLEMEGVLASGCAHTLKWINAHRPRGWVAVLALLLLLWSPSLPAQVFNTLLNFNDTNGAWPSAVLIQGTDGKLYSTTQLGGTAINCGGGCGTVYKTNTRGKLTTVYNFCSQENCFDGDLPNASLVQAANGDFYGPTNQGGIYHFGTLFKLNPKGILTTLYSFCEQQPFCPDGDLPLAPLIQATDHKFYGTTPGGGADDGNGGTVFVVTSSGKYRVLYRFCQDVNCPDGWHPEGALVQAVNGNFYGTTGAGGALGYGTIFKVNPKGKLITLYSFCHDFPQCSDGREPAGALVQATDGSFYGTTVYGGTSSNCPFGCGTVFKITPSGALTTLHSFDKAGGWFPHAGVIQATDGNFYGTAVYGGISSNCFQDGCGTIFKITPNGVFTMLHSFDDTDGSDPYAGLLQATNGVFYGVTQHGGDPDCALSCGTIFKLSVGLKPFVGMRPTSGNVGTKVIILGTNLTGTTEVNFNGAAAQFTVVSKSEIKTTVPVGATTGKINVTTPSGTLSSNVPFRVTN